MPTVNRNGLDRWPELNLPADIAITHCAAPRGKPLDDVAAAVEAAIANPLDFPPFIRACVPGDRVVVALDHEVPQLPQVVAPLVEMLLQGKIDPEDISLLWTQAANESGVDDPRSLLPAKIRETISLVTHDPDNREQLGFLTSTIDGEPVHLNRLLVEADVVIPVAATKSSNRLTVDGPCRHLYPTFSDSDAQRQFAATANPDANPDAHPDADPAATAGVQPSADTVAWLLGVLFVVEIVPGPGDSVLEVLAGETKAVAHNSAQAWQSAWQFSVPRPADLVVVTLEGRRVHHTWAKFARALAVATAVAADDAAIVVCSELEATPGVALRLAAEAKDWEETLGELRDSDDVVLGDIDLEAAVELAAALERTRVYLISRLEDDVVEELGMTPLAGAESIERLAQWADSCILISNAQFATAKVDAE